jgi:hypothetical protein
VGRAQVSTEVGREAAVPSDLVCAKADTACGQGSHPLSFHRISNSIDAKNGCVMDGLVDLDFEFKDLMLILIMKLELNTKLEEIVRDGGRSSGIFCWKKTERIRHSHGERKYLEMVGSD